MRVGRSLSVAPVLCYESIFPSFVADGVDPHVTVLVDDTPMEEGGRKVARVFVYQRNVERFAGAPESVVDEIVTGLERELTAIFPDLVSGMRSRGDEPDDPTLN